VQQRSVSSQEEPDALKKIQPRCFKNIEVSSVYSHTEENVSLSPNVAARRTWGAEKSSLFPFGFWQVSFSVNRFPLFFVVFLSST